MIMAIFKKLLINASMTTVLNISTSANYFTNFTINNMIISSTNYSKTQKPSSMTNYPLIITYHDMHPLQNPPTFIYSELKKYRHQLPEYLRKPNNILCNISTSILFIYTFIFLLVLYYLCYVLCQKYLLFLKNFLLHVNCQYLIV